MSRLTFVKLGGSLITDKRRPGTPRLRVIARLAEELVRAQPHLQDRIILGHGSGSFGHVAAAGSGLGEGVRHGARLSGVSRTQLEAARLDRMVVEALARAGGRPFVIAPSAAMMARGGRPVAVGIEPLLRALELGLLPVVYGDVVLDRLGGASICSTETLFLALARHLLRRRFRISRVLWLGETDGIYDAQGRTVPRVTSETRYQVRRQIGRPAGTDVTGGMLHRFETAWALARIGIPSWILNGRRAGALEGALRGQTISGTEIVAIE